MKLSIEIETFDKMLSVDLFETNKFSAGQTEKTVTEGVSIQYEGGLIRKAIGFPEIVNVAVYMAEHVALPIAVGVLSRHLHDKLKNKKDTSIKINSIPVEINAEKIEKLIIEILKKDEEG